MACWTTSCTVATISSSRLSPSRTAAALISSSFIVTSGNITNLTPSSSNVFSNSGNVDSNQKSSWNSFAMPSLMATGFPSRNMIKLGNFLILNSLAMNIFLSSTVFSLSLTFHRTKSTLSSYRGCALRSTLSRSLHGPHHGANASTSTARPGEDGGSRSVCKLSSVMVWMFAFSPASEESSVANRLEDGLRFERTRVDEKDSEAVSMAMNAATDTFDEVFVVIAANKVAATALADRALLFVRLEFILEID
mmetsp:Transcript_47096/g.98756  ORF Transcript_47096/g.98756 Transcript_47096/m.98756 type:complete len:250 (-) Transcript_47096:436-1185(-)